MLDKIIFASYALLFFLVPLFWTSKNYELFEFNKMMLVYGLTVIITGTWLLKIINRKSLIFNRTPLDIPLLLFLGANILSTIFSIDQHTSVWGYYSRANGGLLSLISYLLLYWAFVSNIDKDQVSKLLKIGLVSGFIISVYAILEHFGVSPSCVILHGQFNAGCWVQDVQSRVFATLGQPNWLAAYLTMLIFPAIYFFLTASTQKQLITYHLSLITLYLAFTFTFSRGAALGLIAGMVIFLVTHAIHLRGGVQVVHQKLHLGGGVRGTKVIFTILGSFLLINLLFGSALTGGFRLIKQAAPPPRPTIGSSTTQLEAGGTESGQIRLIVWRGALDIFKHYPIFGSGVETFAYSYYQFRPAAHNLVSEWDFLYNKAHNEFLNYLATTGIVGFTSYLIIIITFIIVILRRLEQANRLLLISLLAAYISYLVQNFFGFSVVIIALFFYLFPALAFVISNSAVPLNLKLRKNLRFPYLNQLLMIRSIIISSRVITIPVYFIIIGISLILRYKYNISYLIITPISFLLILSLASDQTLRKIGRERILRGIVLLEMLFLLRVIINFWYADTLFAKGQQANEASNPGRAYNFLTDAVRARKDEPFYHSELGYAAASAALALKDSKATLSAELKDQALNETQQVLAENSHNTSFWRTAIRAYFELYGLDESFLQKTLEATDRTIALAPTDAKLYYNKAIILGQVGRNEEAVASLQKALELKPNYQDALVALDKLNEWGKEGVTTQSGEVNR